MRDTNKILSLDSLKIGYPSGVRKKVLLPPLNAFAGKGELIAVVGRNGIGKSTLLRTIAGLQLPLDGDVLYEGKRFHEYSRSELARNIGYISTEIVKVTNMTVYDLVALGRFPHTNWFGKISGEDNDIILDAIDKTSMTTFYRRYISELSDGERQKAMIARILAQDTQLMIMDEPTAFLDIGSKYEILHIMHQLTQRNDKTIIFSTHDLHLATGQSDKVWLILDDRLCEGAPEDLMIEGVFNHLFESASVRFSSETGDFSFWEEQKGALYIEGDGTETHWTREALQRAGYSVSQEKTSPYIHVSSGTDLNWQIISQDSAISFTSIYDLIYYLTRSGIVII